MMEGLQERLEVAVTPECSAGKLDEKELCRSATADLGLQEGQAEQL